MNKKKFVFRIFAFIGMTAGALAAFNKIIEKQAVSKRLLVREKPCFFQSDFGRVFYTKKGTGAPILLLHDLDCTSSGYEWEEAEILLSKNYTVYNLDLLGFGRSEKPFITYTNFVYVSLLKNFVHQVIGSAPVVITSGLSSSLAIAAQHYSPQIFSQIICVNPQPLLSSKKMPGSKDLRRKKFYSIPVIGTFFYNLVYSKKKIASKALLADFYNPANIPERYVDHCYEACHLGGRKAKAAYLSLCSNFLNFPVSKFLKSIEVPVYFIGGFMEDSITETLDQYVLCNHRFQIYLIENTIHLPHLEKPEEFVHLVSEII